MRNPRVGDQQTGEWRPVERPGAVYAPDAVLVIPFWGMVQGAEAIRRHEAAIEAAFPGFVVRVLRYVEVEDIRAVDWMFHGTNAGPLVLAQGLVPATHRPVTLRGATFLRFTPARLIAEEHRYYDICGLLGQLGLS